jgi:hypothetical protein
MPKRTELSRSPSHSANGASACLEAAKAVRQGRLAKMQRMPKGNEWPARAAKTRRDGVKAEVEQHRAGTVTVEQDRADIRRQPGLMAEWRAELEQDGLAGTELQDALDKRLERAVKQKRESRLTAEDWLALDGIYFAGCGVALGYTLLAQVGWVDQDALKQGRLAYHPVVETILRLHRVLKEDYARLPLQSKAVDPIESALDAIYRQPATQYALAAHETVQDSPDAIGAEIDAPAAILCDATTPAAAPGEPAAGIQG